MSQEIARFRWFSFDVSTLLTALTPRRGGLHTASPPSSPPTSETEIPP